MSYTSGRIYGGQKTGITTSAVQIVASADDKAIREALIQSDPANTTNVLVGNVDAQYVVLTPGQSVTIPVISLTRVYVKMSSGTGSVNWLSRD